MSYLWRGICIVLVVLVLGIAQTVQLILTDVGRCYPVKYITLAFTVVPPKPHFF